MLSSKIVGGDYLWDKSTLYFVKKDPWQVLLSRGGEYFLCHFILLFIYLALQSTTISIKNRKHRIPSNKCKQKHMQLKESENRIRFKRTKQWCLGRWSTILWPKLRGKVGSSSDTRHARLLQGYAPKFHALKWLMGTPTVFSRAHNIMTKWVWGYQASPRDQTKPKGSYLHTSTPGRGQFAHPSPLRRKASLFLSL